MKKEAAALGAGVNGSEVVGLIPLEALLMAGRFYDAQGDEKAIVRAAIEKLGLSAIEPFVPEKKVIEYMIPRG